MVVAGLLFSIKSEEKRFTKQTWLNMIPGVMWATGNLALLFSNKLVGIATGFRSHKWVLSFRPLVESFS